MFQQQGTERLEELLTIREVKNILGVSYGIIYGLVQDEKLRCWKVTGEPVSKYEVGESSWGLRFRPSDVRTFLDHALIQ